MHWKRVGLVLALAVRDAFAAPADGLMARQFAQAAMMRFQCSQLVYDRIDPLVQPGMLPSTHMHQVRPSLSIALAIITLPYRLSPLVSHPYF